jgi:carbamoyl-phosphate synthase large subunit
VPFVSKAIGRPLAKIAAKVMVGRTLADLGMTEIEPRHVSVKEVVFPFVKFEGVDTILGPEMRSTGEVMGIDTDFARAFMKSMLASGTRLPTTGTAFLSVREQDKPAIVEIGRACIHPDCRGGTVKAYLRLAAWIGGEPAWDPDFNTADLFVFLPIARVEARYARRQLKTA